MKKEKDITGLALATELKTLKVRLFHIVIYAILIVVVMVSLLPILWAFLSAFKDTKEFLRIPPTLLPQTFHIEYIPIVWKKASFGISYIYTLMNMAGSCLFTIVFSGLAGYVTALLKPKGIKYVSKIIFWTMMIPGTVSTVPLFMTFVDFPLLHINLANTYIPMWMLAGSSCFNILLFKTFFEGIPREYLEAARIDGCSELSIFGRVIIPLSKPIIVTVTVFSATYALNDFFWPYLIINDKNMQPVSVKLFALRDVLPENEYMLALLFVLIPAALLFVIFQKYIMEGANVGGIKG